MKERVDKALAEYEIEKNISYCTENSNNMAELIKDLWQENQALKAEKDGILGANAINKLSIAELEENQRIAIEALEGYHNAFKNLILEPHDRLIPIRKKAEQALSTIRGK